MTRYEELQQTLNKATDIYHRHRQMCWQSTKVVGNALNKFIGAQATSYFNWEQGEPGTQETFTDAFEWEAGEDPEMIVGLAVSVETPIAFNHLGFKLSLKPTGEKVIASIGDDHVLIKTSESGSCFDDVADGDRFLGNLFEEIKQMVATPCHQRIDDGRKFGFHTKEDR